jgi:cell division protein FtsQ
MRSSSSATSPCLTCRSFADSGEVREVPAEAAPADIRHTAAAIRLVVTRFAPSRRSLLAGAAVIAIAAGGYAIARETSIFAIHQVDVTGGSPAVDAQVERALAPLVGRSLVGFNGAELLQRTDALSTVVDVTYDRAFPNTLRVKIVPEHPVAVLRDGAAAWLVSDRGRVIRSVALQRFLALPRIWAAKMAVRAGDMLPLRIGGVLTRSLAAAGPLRARIAAASLASGQLVFHLRSGLELVLGAPTDVPLKVAVAARVLLQLPPGTRSVDVSVPSRPVTSLQSASS